MDMTVYRWTVVDIDDTWLINIRQLIPHDVWFHSNAESAESILSYRFMVNASVVCNEKKERVDYCFFDDLIRKTVELFDRVDFDQWDCTTGMIEYWKYTNLISTGDHVHLDVHMDDYAILDFPVYTAIYYLTKTVSGGELCIHDDLLNVTDVIDVTPPHDHVRVVLLHGSIPHSIGNILSDGIRECIVVQLKRKAN